jgi:hypothetical protein
MFTEKNQLKVNLYCEKHNKYTHTFTVWQNSDINIIAGGTYSYHWAINGKRRDYKSVRPGCSADNYTVRFRAEHKRYT